MRHQLSHDHQLITRQPPVYRPKPLVIVFHSPTLISPRLPSSHLRHCPHHSRLRHLQPKPPLQSQALPRRPPPTLAPSRQPCTLAPPCPRSQVLSRPQLKLLPPPLPSLLAIPFVSLLNHSHEENDPPTVSHRGLILLLGYLRPYVNFKIKNVTLPLTLPLPQLYLSLLS